MLDFKTNTVIPENLFLKHSKVKLIGIYKITNTLNNNVYIGASEHILKRLMEHFKRFKYSLYFNISSFE